MPLSTSQAGLAAPGRNVYQFKWRDPARGRNTLLAEMGRELGHEGKRFASYPPVLYVTMTNLSLTVPNNAALRSAFREGCPTIPEGAVRVWGAGEIAAFVSLHARLALMFFWRSNALTVTAAPRGVARTLPGWDLDRSTGGS